MIHIIFALTEMYNVDYKSQYSGRKNMAIREELCLLIKNGIARMQSLWYNPII